MHKVVALVFLLLLVVIFWNYVEAAGKYFFIAKMYYHFIASKPVKKF